MAPGVAWIEGSKHGTYGREDGSARDRQTNEVAQDIARATGRLIPKKS